MHRRTTSIPAHIFLRHFLVVCYDHLYCACCSFTMDFKYVQGHWFSYNSFQLTKPHFQALLITILQYNSSFHFFFQTIFSVLRKIHVSVFRKAHGPDANEASDLLRMETKHFFRFVLSALTTMDKIRFTAIFFPCL